MQRKIYYKYKHAIQPHTYYKYMMKCKMWACVCLSVCVCVHVALASTLLILIYLWALWGQHFVCIVVNWWQQRHRRHAVWITLSLFNSFEFMDNGRNKKKVYTNKKCGKKCMHGFRSHGRIIVHDSRVFFCFFFSVLFEEIMITEISGFLSHFFLLVRLLNANFVQIQFIYDIN